MLKRDYIFWLATAIFLLAIVVAWVTENQLWLSLMVISYLLRPTLASLGVGKRGVDERQMTIHYRSGNIAFAVMMITCIILDINLASKGDPSWEMFNIAIIVGLATKALFNVLLVKNYREAGMKIIIAVGFMITLFVAAEHAEHLVSLDALMEALPGLIIIGIGLLSRKYPRVVGSLLLLVTVAILVLILSKGITIAQITTAILLCVPLVVAGLCLFARNTEESELAEDGSQILSIR